MSLTHAPFMAHMPVKSVDRAERYLRCDTLLVQAVYFLQTFSRAKDFGREVEVEVCGVEDSAVAEFLSLRAFVRSL